jgi:hypothetical protein
MSETQNEENLIINESVESYLPINDVMVLADQIWNDIKHNSSSDDNKMEIYYSKYKSFANAFPLVLKWMIQMNVYNKSAFKKFLYKYNNTKISDKSSFLTLQAEYLVYIYRESKHVTSTQINEYRKYVINALLEEDKEFEKIQDQIKQEKSLERRKNLYNYLKSNPL